MAKPRNKIADYLVYLALKLVTALVRMFPVPAVYRVAGFGGNLWYRLDARHRDRTIEHLRGSFPDWSEARLEDVARGSFRSLVYLGIEALLTTKLVTYWRWRRHISIPDPSEAARLLLERKSGVIMVSGHLGGWEVAGCALAALGFEGYAIARALDNPYLNRYLLGAREKMGLKILDKRGAMELMDYIFSQRYLVSFVADQDAGPSGLFVDFLGRQASTYKAPALMAMQHQVPLVVGYGLRLDETYSFELGFERIIYPHQWADKPDPMRWITQEYTSALENVVRRRPEQYLWIYRRWKSQPRIRKQSRPKMTQ